MKNNDSDIKFIYNKPSLPIFLIIFYILFIGTTIVFALYKDSYDKLSVKGIVDNNTIVIPTTIDNVTNISKSKKMKIDDKYHKFKINNYSEIYNEGNINVQDVIVSSDVTNKMNNQVLDITFYYNKEPMYKKILRGVFKWKN